MSPECLEAPRDPEAQRAAARSRTYRLFAELLGYPDAELVEAVGAGRVAAALRETLNAVDPALSAELDTGALSQAGGADDLAVEYTRLFDVGAAGPPCPLYGGLYGGDRMKVMEEAVRFYNHFGLTLSEAPRELPDHLTTELEFLHYLTFREAEGLESGEAVDSLRRAERDFVARHPGRWVPRLLERLGRHSPPPFLEALLHALASFLRREEKTLNEAAGPGEGVAVP